MQFFEKVKFRSLYLEMQNTKYVVCATLFLTYKTKEKSVTMFFLSLSNILYFHLVDMHCWMARCEIEEGLFGFLSNVFTIYHILTQLDRVQSTYFLLYFVLGTWIKKYYRPCEKVRNLNYLHALCHFFVKINQRKLDHLISNIFSVKLNRNEVREVRTKLCHSI